MRVIECNVTIDQIIKTTSILPLHIGTKGDKNCTELRFNLDSAIEGKYHYVKFFHPKRTVLQKIENGKVVVASNVTSLNGRWMLTFISSDSTISYESADGNYIFCSIPFECEVSDGYLDINIADDAEKKIEELEAKVDKLNEQVTSMLSLEQQLFTMNLSKLTVPDYIVDIGAYFLYNGKLSNCELVIGTGVRRIGDYAFYSDVFKSITFKATSSLEALADYALNKITINGSITFPASLSDFGHYVLKGSSLLDIRFEAKSRIRTLNANAFNGISCDGIYLPDGLETIATNGYVFRENKVNTIWIPSSLVSSIVQTVFKDNEGLKNIVLESDFNVSANFVNCSDLTHDSIVEMFNSLRDNTGSSVKSLTLGSTNLAKVSDAEKLIAINKNWTLS